jgi:hypothetical protein
MKTLIDALLVGSALLASLASLYKTLGPRVLKARVAAQLSGLAARAPSSYGLRRLLTGLATASAARGTGGCGGCEGCAPAPAATAPAEVRVPLTAIGRR